MIKHLFILLIVLLIADIAAARPMIADVNPRKIDIDHNFKGINILVYGARNYAGNIIVVVRGPKQKQILRKKGRVAGIWTNVKNIELDNFYSFYAVSSLKPLDSVQNAALLKRLEIGKDSIELVTPKKVSAKEQREIKEAAIEIMEHKNLFNTESYEVSLWGETLFRTFVELPKNITKGTYTIDIYLFNDGLLHTFQTLPIIVDKVGLEAILYEAAHRRPLLYGILCVSMALLIGWIVGSIFTRKLA